MSHNTLLRILAALVVLAFCASLPQALACESCKNTIHLPYEPFAEPRTVATPGWIKFVILTGAPATVIFQDSRRYRFHYDFAAAELAPFVGMSRAEFDAVTLHVEGQHAILGAVLVPPTAHWDTREYGIQLIRQEPFEPAELRSLLDTVISAIETETGWQVFYFPTYEQQASAEDHADYLAEHGITISSTARWADRNPCYAHGWALGRLKQVRGDEIWQAYLSGALTSDDILLADGIPADIPPLAGVISLSPATPSSHPALLASTFGIPFVHAALPAEAQRAQQLVGRRIVLRAEEARGWCRVRLIDVEGVLSEAAIDSILTLKQPRPLDIAPLEHLGAYAARTDGLQLADVRTFGGKAAHAGLLRRAIPDSSPVSVAFSFDLWNEFLDQPFGGGKSLRQEIARRLAEHPYPPNLTALSATLEGVRELVKDASFSASLRGAVLAALQDPQYGFEPSSNLRFRSSTNVEDTERFTGAGLYDSFSGCLADDLDPDGQGPSLCDPSEDSERGVFRAIRKVFASFYNLNAYLERLRHAIDENTVGMALLVHDSFPDQLELANGVATLERSTHQPQRVRIVSQVGADSVTNPVAGHEAEEVVIGDKWGFPALAIARPSNQIQLGATVLSFPGEYQDLQALLERVAGEYGRASGRAELALEFEFKKVAPDGVLTVKQVRPILGGSGAGTVTPFLVSEPTEYCTYWQDSADLSAVHRMKVRLSLTTDNDWLTPVAREAGFFADSALQFHATCRVRDLGGPLGHWPGAAHAVTPSGVSESFRFGWIPNLRELRLNARVPAELPESRGPVLTLRDLGCMEVGADYVEPVLGGPMWVDGDARPHTTDSATICPCPAPETLASDSPARRTIRGTEGVMIETALTGGSWESAPLSLFPKAWGGGSRGYTRFVETTITGMTSTPIVLHSEYSQSYLVSGRHVFVESYLFEPAAEPNLPIRQRMELAAAGIRVIGVAVESTWTDEVQTGQFYYASDDEWGDQCLEPLRRPAVPRESRPPERPIPARRL